MTPFRNRCVRIYIGCGGGKNSLVPGIKLLRVVVLPLIVWTAHVPRWPRRRPTISSSDPSHETTPPPVPTPNVPRPGAGPRSPPADPEEPALFPGEPGPRPSTGPSSPKHRSIWWPAGPAWCVGAGPPVRRIAAPRCRRWFRWSAVQGVSVTHPALLPDGSVGKVVEIDLADGDVAGGGSARARYVLPTGDVGPFLAAVSAGTEAGAAGRRRLVPVADGRWPSWRPARWRVGAATGWAASLRPSRRLIPSTAWAGVGSGPSPSGVLALVLLAGSGRAFESAGQRGPRAGDPDPRPRRGQRRTGLPGPPGRRPAAGHVDPGAGPTLAGRRRTAASPTRSSGTPPTGPCPSRPGSTSEPDHAGLLQRRRQRRRHPQPERRRVERLREPGSGRTWSTGPTPPGTGWCSP